jgi:hypothetical protein
MPSLGATHLIALLLAVAIIASIGGFVASAARRKNKRRARRWFALGFVCGLVAGAKLGTKRPGLNLRAAPLAGVRSLRVGTRGGTGQFAPRALAVAASHLGSAMLRQKL